MNTLERYLIKDYEHLPLFLKPKELKRIIPVSEPTLYALLTGQVAKGL